VEVVIEEQGRVTRLVFSGDIGRPNTPILRDPVQVPQADFLIVESTYGDRLHAASDPEPKMQQLVRETVARGGKVIIPAFAIGRTQEIVYSLHEMMEAGKIAPIPVYVDSPMAREATELTARHVELYDAEARGLLRSGRRPFRFSGLKLLETVDQSRALNDRTEPCIIISASGMCNAGRIKHHLRHNLPGPKNTVALVGYQAVGTLGRLLQDGMPEVRIFGELVPVRARIETVPGYSAHADRDELLGWLKGFEQAPRQTFVVHGEKEVALTFARTLAEQRQWTASAPRLGERFE
jgi:metallo-beta-lactamase family protein